MIDAQIFMLLREEKSWRIITGVDNSRENLLISNISLDIFIKMVCMYESQKYLKELNK